MSPHIDCTYLYFWSDIYLGIVPSFSFKYLNIRLGICSGLSSVYFNAFDFKADYTSEVQVI